MFTLAVAILRGLMRLIGRSARALREFIRVMSSLHRSVYRLTGGTLGGRLGLRNARILLLTTIGRKTGRQWTIPLLSINDEDDLVVVASHGGLDQPPAWWLNLKANPEALVQIGHRTLRVRAENANPEKRDQLWRRFVKEFPGYEDYRNRTQREIPIILLHPFDHADG